MALAKRGLPFDDEHRFKRAKVSESVPCQFPGGDVRVVLNPADCDIDFNVEGDGLQGSALYGEGFAYCWSGARANIGIRSGKYYFGCKIMSAQPVEMEDTPLDQQHVCRVGISRGDDSVRNLGETAHSFGFGGTGKFSNSGNFVGYGENFGVGDSIVCYVDLESRPMASISFSKNGKWLGIAKHFNADPSGLGLCGSPMKNLRWESALFPHVLLKNVVVQLQFTIDDGLVPVQGYKPWAAAVLDGNAVLGPSFSNPADCEVIMMVGLPASGKTTWADKFVMEHPEKRYVLLGTNLALEQMKVPGLLRKHNYGERFDRLMDCATKIFNVLLFRASKIPRNFIIDQTNVYKSARKRKLKPFANYIKIAVVVFPRPEELKVRANKRFKEMGKEVPAEAVNQMLANFILPVSKDMHMADEYFDQVLFVESNQAESQRLLDEMKRELLIRPAVPLHSLHSPTVSHHLLQSSSSLSFQNQGAGDTCRSSWPPSQAAACRSYHSSAHDSDDVMGSFRGYKGSNVNEPWGTVQSNHSVESIRNISHGVSVDPSRTYTAEPYPRNVYDDRFASGLGGCRPSGLPATRHFTYHSDVPATRHFTYHSAPLFSHGSYGTPISRPPSLNDVQHGKLWRPSSMDDLATDVQPSYGSFPMDRHHVGEYPYPQPPLNYHTDARHHLPSFPRGY